MLVRGWKDAMYKAMGKPKYLAEKKSQAEKGMQEIGRKAKNEVMSMIEDRKTAQKNFKNRTSNKNYYGSTKSWMKK